MNWHPLAQKIRRSSSKWLSVASADLLRLSWWPRAGMLHHWPAVVSLRRAARIPRTPLPSNPEQISETFQIALVAYGRLEGTRNVSLAPSEASSKNPPLISCMLVTRERVAMAQRGIQAFLAQTYPNKELVVVDDDPSDELANWIAGLNDSRIVSVRLPDRSAALGALRNLAVSRARGEFVAQWDDDDISHPRRLEVQLAAIRAHGLDAAFLHRHQMWWPGQTRAALSIHRLWEGSMICRRGLLPDYPSIARGEDTPVAEIAAVRGRLALLDMPALYTYLVHGANTFATAHFEYYWKTATARYEGERYQRWLERLKAAVGDACVATFSSLKL